MARKIIYEPHPVSAERKAELMEKGFKIMDARFAPAGAEPAIEKPVAEKPAEPKAVAKPAQTDDNAKKVEPRKVKAK